MIKGVNKRIVEVSNTNNKYFYKALLFVKPDYSNVSNKKIEVEAGKYLTAITLNSPVKSGYLRKRRKIKSNILLGMFLFGIAALTVAMLCLLK